MPPARPQIQVTLQGSVNGSNFGPMNPKPCTTGLQKTVDCAHDEDRDGEVFVMGAVSSWALANCGSATHYYPHNLNLVDDLRGTPPNPALWSPSQTLAFDTGLHSGQNFALALGDRVHFSHTRAPIWGWKAPP